MRIGIVNYSIGNVGSVYSAFKFYNYDICLVDDPKTLGNVDMIVLAGVGNFPTALSRLSQRRLWEKIDKEVTVKKKPVFGICLGMQLFADMSYENGRNNGFGWISGKVMKMEGPRLRIPHIGWNKVKPLCGKLFSGIRYNFFYYMHSYHFVPKDKKVIIATTNYNGLEIVSAVRKDNIIGVQFHPEKSQGDGLRLIRNIVEEFK